MGGSFSINLPISLGDPKPVPQADGSTPALTGIGSGTTTPTNNALNPNTQKPPVQVSSNSEASQKGGKLGGPNSVTIGAQNSGHITEQTTSATLGSGIINGVASTDAPLVDSVTGEAVNRDVAKAQVITRDQDTGGLDASITIDGRMFSKEGWASITNDFRASGQFLKDVTAVTGSGVTVVLGAGAGLLSGNFEALDNGVEAIAQSLGITYGNWQLTRDVQAAQDGETAGVFTQMDAANGLDVAINGQDPNAPRINVTRALADKNGNVIGATYNSANGQMYLSQLNMSDLVNNVAHEGMHAAGAGEFLSSVVGNLSSYAFSVGTWANQDNVNRYSASYNLLDNNAAAQNRLLNSNATRYLFERQTQPTLFDDRALTRRESQAIFEEARALTSGQGEAAQKLMTLRLVSAALKRVDGEYQNNQSAIDDPVADGILKEMREAPGQSGLFIATPKEKAEDYRFATGDGLEKALDKFNTHIEATQQAISRQDKKMLPEDVNLANAAGKAVLNLPSDTINLATMAVEGNYNLFRCLDGCTDYETFFRVPDVTDVMGMPATSGERLLGGLLLPGVGAFGAELAVSSQIRRAETAAEMNYYRGLYTADNDYLSFNAAMGMEVSGVSPITGATLPSTIAYAPLLSQSAGAGQVNLAGVVGSVDAEIAFYQNFIGPLPEKGLRADPSTYLSQLYQDVHAALFNDGVVRIQPTPPTGKIGHTETWVLPRAVAEAAIANSQGSITRLEELLGFDAGYLGKVPVRVDIPSPTGYRIPTGNEFGANGFWRPGGYTWPGGLPEAVINPVKPGNYVVKPVFQE